MNTIRPIIANKTSAFYNLLFIFLAYAISFEFLVQDAEKIVVICLLTVLTSIFFFTRDSISSFLESRTIRIKKEYDVLYEARVNLLKSLINYHLNIINFHENIIKIFIHIKSRLEKIHNSRKNTIYNLTLLLLKDELKVIAAEELEFNKKLHLNKLSKAFLIFTLLLNGVQDKKISLNGGDKTAINNWNKNYNLKLDSNILNTVTGQYLKNLVSSTNNLNKVPLMFINKQTYKNIAFSLLINSQFNNNKNWAPFLYLYLYSIHK